MVSTKRRELLTRLYCINIPEDLNRMPILQDRGELGHKGRFWDAGIRQLTRDEMN